MSLNLAQGTSRPPSVVRLHQLPYGIAPFGWRAGDASSFFVMCFCFMFFPDGFCEDWTWGYGGAAVPSVGACSSPRSLDILLLGFGVADKFFLWCASVCIMHSICLPAIEGCICACLCVCRCMSPNTHTHARTNCQVHVRVLMVA